MAQSPAIRMTYDTEEVLGVKTRKTILKKKNPLKHDLNTNFHGQDFKVK